MLERITEPARYLHGMPFTSMHYAMNVDFELKNLPQNYSKLEMCL